jgi:hypothetical protein
MKILIDEISASADGGTATVVSATVDRLRLISGGRLFDGHAPDAVLWPEDFTGGTALAGAFDLAPTDWLVWVIHHPPLSYAGGTGGWQYGSRQRWGYSTTPTPPAWLHAPNITTDATVLITQDGLAGVQSLYLHERLAKEEAAPLFLTRAELWIFRDEAHD